MKLRKLFMAVSFAVGFINVSSFAEQASPYEWEITRVDEREGFMHSPSLVADSGGTIYLSYIVSSSPPGEYGSLYVAKREAGDWTRTLVCEDTASFSTCLAINPVTQCPGVAYIKNAGTAGQRLGFFEFDGSQWIPRDVPTLSIMALNSLEYTSDGEAFISYGYNFTFGGESFWQSYVIHRTVADWENIPLPIEGDWLSFARYGTGIAAVGASRTGGHEGLRTLEILPYLPDVSVIEMDRLSESATSGNILSRTPALAENRDGDLLIAYTSVWSNGIEGYAGVKLSCFHGNQVNEPETLIFGGTASNPTGYWRAMGFCNAISMAINARNIPFIFGQASDYAHINVTFPQHNGWSCFEVDSAPTCGGVWRGRAAIIDSHSDTPIVAYSKGPAWRYDTVIYVAQLVAPSGDSNGDGDVDLVDYVALSECFTGPNSTPEDTVCLRYFDFDLDYDVDLQDFALFQTYFGRN